jgi:type I restriction enzyme R subunit
MTGKITENEIELFAIEQFEQFGYQYVYGPSIAPDAAQPERSRWDEVLLPWPMRGKFCLDHTW